MTLGGGIRLEWAADSGRELILILPPTAAGAVHYYRFSAEPAFEEEVEARNVQGLPAMLE